MIWGKKTYFLVEILEASGLGSTGWNEGGADLDPPSNRSRNKDQKPFFNGSEPENWGPIYISTSNDPLLQAADTMQVFVLVPCNLVQLAHSIVPFCKFLPPNNRWGWCQAGKCP
eukprot:TRINITY_DN22678_c1_g3_i1.p1 TRINITY_DN22678_c1_g3~~TRINITY_DN22678_c1_g3_i1.p1  ORF type:complete len:114 (+),score=11.90 TRINITY_DN22678_c1_g3_i1:955-1296(+)